MGKEYSVDMGFNCDKVPGSRMGEENLHRQWDMREE